MNLIKKLMLPSGLMVVFLILAVTLCFSATDSNPTMGKPQPAPIIIKSQPAPKEKSTAPQPAPKEKPAPVVDPVATYKNTCGQCHMPYPPEFLPSGSWEKLLGSTEKHFEGPLEIDPKTKDGIALYLKEKGAESSSSSLSKKLMQSLDGNTPLRITEIPYIVKKHRKIKPEDFKRKSIGSFSNCSACHLLADKWIFTRRIKIPE